MTQEYILEMSTDTSLSRGSTVTISNMIGTVFDSYPVSKWWKPISWEVRTTGSIKIRFRETGTPVVLVLVGVIVAALIWAGIISYTVTEVSEDLTEKEIVNTKASALDAIMAALREGAITDDQASAMISILQSMEDTKQQTGNDNIISEVKPILYVVGAIILFDIVSKRF